MNASHRDASAIPGVLLYCYPNIVPLKYKSGLIYHREEYTSLSANTGEDELAEVAAAIATKASAVNELRCIFSRH
jgi:hypothetical protein